MAIGHVGTVTVGSSSLTATYAATLPGGISAGDFLIAYADNGTYATVSSQPGNGWTFLVRVEDGTTGTSSACDVYWKAATGSDAFSITYSATTRANVTVDAKSGVDTADPFIAYTPTGPKSGTGSDWPAQSITNTDSAAWGIYHTGSRGYSGAGVTYTVGSGLTERVDYDSGSTSTARMVSVTADSNGAVATGAVAYTATSSTASGNGATFAALLRPGSGGGGGPITPTVASRITTPGNRKVRTRTANATSVRLRIYSDSGLTTPLGYTAAQTPDASGFTTHTTTGLATTPGTRYWYRVALTDSGSTETLDTLGTIGSFRVPATDTATWAFSSCTQSTDSFAMQNVAARAATLDAFLSHGDWFYNDGMAKTVASHRTEQRNKINATHHASVLAQIPADYTPSDHDGGENNSTAGTDATSWANWNTVYEEEWPVDRVPASGAVGMYHTFDMGPVRFWVTDGRSFASAPSATDNSSKTKLGATQKQWLKDGVAALPSTMVGCIVTDVPWVGSAVAGDDAWIGYTTERTELGTAFTASGNAGRVFLTHGDAHMLGADSGANGVAGMASFCAAPLYNDSSIKPTAADYSQGTYPTVDGTANLSMYAVMTAVRSGTNVAVTYTGYEVPIAGGSDTQRLTYTKNYTVSSGAQAGAATSSVPVTLTAAGVRTAPAAASTSVPATLTAAGVRTATAAATMSAPSTLSAAGTRTAVATATLTVPSTMSAAAERTTSAAATMTVPESLTASAVGTQPGAATLSTPVTMTSAGVRAVSGAATLSVPSTLTSQGLRTAVAAATLAVPSTLSAAATRTTSAAAVMSVPSTMGASERPSYAIAARDAGALISLSLDESSGTYSDVSGDANHGTLTGTNVTRAVASLLPGEPAGAALSLNPNAPGTAADAYVSMPVGATALGFTDDPWTVAFTIKGPDPGSATQGRVFAVAGPATGANPLLSLAAAGANPFGRLALSLRGDDSVSVYNAALGSGIVLDGAAHHVIVSWSSSNRGSGSAQTGTWLISIDGSETTGDVTFTRAATSYSFAPSIGALLRSAGANYLTAVIDAFAFFPTALSAPQRAVLADSWASAPVPGNASMSVPVTTGVSSTATRAATATFGAPSTLSATATRTQPAAAVLGAPATLVTAGTRETQGAAVLSVPSTLTAAATVDAAVPLASFSDPFDGASLGAGWTTVGDVSVSGGAVRIKSPTTTYALATRTPVYTAAETSVYVQVPPQVPFNATSSEQFLRVELPNATNVVIFGRTGSGGLICRIRTANVDNSTYPAQPAGTRFWCLRFTGGNVIWETSPDASTWTAQRTVSTAGLDLTTAKLVLSAGHYNSAHDAVPAPDEGVFEGVNISDISQGGATFSAPSTLGASGVATRSAASTLAVPEALSSSAARTTPAAATMSAPESLTPSGTTSATLAMSVPSTMTLSAIATRQAQAVLLVASTLSASSASVRSGAVTMSVPVVTVPNGYSFDPDAAAFWVTVTGPTAPVLIVRGPSSLSLTVSGPHGLQTLSAIGPRRSEP